MTEGKLNALAIALQVTNRDLECLVNSVFSEISKDGLSEHFCMLSTQEERGEIIKAYVSHANIKFRDFAISYMSNEEKKEAFNCLVKGLIYT